MVSVSDARRLFPCERTLGRVRFTTRPLWTAIIGSNRSLRSARSRASIRSSSEPASLLYPTTSDTSIAASFRVSGMSTSRQPTD